MRMKPFEFKAARSLSHALELMDKSGDDARILAGGTDLVLNMKKKRVSPSTIISLHPVTELEYVKEKSGVIHIGALAKHADLAAHPLLKKQVSILCQAVGLIGSWQVRNIGTIGGNLCNASPAADSAPALLALDASVTIAGVNGERSIPLSSFFVGPGQSVMKSGEILTDIQIKQSEGSSAGCYLKLRRRKAVDISLAGAAFQAETDPSGRVLNAVRIALGGVAPTPVRVPDAEACLTGLTIDEALEQIPACAKAAMLAAQPIDDVRASADYKRIIVDVFVQRSARQVLTILKNNGGRS